MTGSAAGPGRVFIATLVSITLIGPLTIHMFLPALPDIRSDLAVSTGLAQLTFSIGVLTTATATLAYGSLSDHFGRRPVLLAGLALFTLGAAMSALAPNIGLLVAGRALQGCGAACGIVLGRTIVRDVYGVERLAQMIAYLTAAYVLGPMFSPTIGGALVDGFGWRAVAVFGASAGVCVYVLAHVVMYETRPRLSASVRIGLLAGYRRLLGSLRFCGFAFQPAFATGAFFAHAASATYLMTVVLHRSAAEFGLFFAFGPAGFMLGSFLSGRYGVRFAREHMVVAGATVSTGAVLLLVGLLTVDGLTAFNLFIPAFFLTFGQGLGMPHAQAAVIATDERLTGTASGIVVFLQFFFGAVAAQFVGVLADGTIYPMITVMLSFSILSLATGCIPAILVRRGREAA